MNTVQPEATPVASIAPVATSTPRSLPLKIKKPMTAKQLEAQKAAKAPEVFDEKEASEALNGKAPQAPSKGKTKKGLKPLSELPPLPALPEPPVKPKYQRPKCPHGKQPYYCEFCGGGGLCCHKKIRSGCSICKDPTGYCTHGKVKQYCDLCGASGKCDHGRRRNRCTICKTGGSVCPCGKVRERCKKCNGTAYCPCGVRKEYCKTHGGSALCDHGKRLTRCDDCHGSERCGHRRDRQWCVECADPDRVCEHKRIKVQCVPCRGALICRHQRRKTHCKECLGSHVCRHSRMRSACPLCRPSIACHHCKYNDVRRSRYKPYCFRCYCVLHPDEPVSRRFRLKEHYVVDALKAHFGDTLTLRCDKRIEDGCTKYRPDILIDYGAYCVIIEIDEFRHTNYTCEMKRMVDLYADLGARNTVFLRFNPDGYTLDGVKHPTPFPIVDGEMEVDQEEMEERLHELIQVIQYYQDVPPEEPLTYTYLFYGDQEEDEADEDEADEAKE